MDQQPASPRRGAGPSTSTSPSRDRTISGLAYLMGLAYLKAAAIFCGHYATMHEDVKSADVLKIAEAFERWVLEVPSD